MRAIDYDHDNMYDACIEMTVLSALPLKLPDSLLHFLLHRLIGVQNSLFVDHNLRRVRPRTAHSRRDRRRVCLNDNSTRASHADQQTVSTKRTTQKSFKKKTEHAPIIYRLIQTQNDAIQILQQGSLLDLIPQE